MNNFVGWGLSFTLLALGVNMPAEAKAPIPQIVVSAPELPNHVGDEREIARFRHLQSKPNIELKTPDIAFSHGDVSWLSALATEAGWPPKTHEKLAKIILRESGGCPNRLGGDAVDKNCNITHVTEWNHRSDTGLLQINGINYNPKRNKWAIACRQMDICTQEPLLDALTNLKVGYLLYKEAGWAPWDPCTWGKEWAHRCNKTKP